MVALANAVNHTVAKPSAKFLIAHWSCANMFQELVEVFHCKNAEAALEQPLNFTRSWQTLATIFSAEIAASSAAASHVIVHMRRLCEFQESNLKHQQSQRDSIGVEASFHAGDRHTTV
jgi:hypothetical protein